MARFWAGFAVALLLVAAAGALALLRGGLSARPEPSAMETAIARKVRGMAMPGEARGRQNPLPASERILAEGRAHFADHCASCHGNDGRGKTEVGKGLSPRPPDLRAPATQGLSDGELFQIIEHGIRFTGMPAWGGEGRPEETWKLVHFIRHLPRLTDEERAEMEKLNPRSPHEWRELEDEEEFLRGGEPAPAPRGSGHHH